MCVTHCVHLCMKKERLTTFVKKEVKQKIAEMAKQYNRTESNMAEILLSDAIDSRQAVKIQENK